MTFLFSLQISLDKKNAIDYIGIANKEKK